MKNITDNSRAEAQTAVIKHTLRALLAMCYEFGVLNSDGMAQHVITIGDINAVKVSALVLYAAKTLEPVYGKIESNIIFEVLERMIDAQDVLRHYENGFCYILLPAREILRG